MSTPRERDEDHQIEPFVLQLENGVLTADATKALYKVPAGKRLRVERVQFAPHAALDAHGSNYFNLKVIKGASTLIANWSTLTGQNGALVANTPVDLVLTATDLDRVVVGGAASDADRISVFYDETGAASFPDGILTIEGRWV